MMLFNVIVCLVLLGTNRAQKIVDTQYGPVQGHTLPVNNGRDTTNVDIFYGIPFAQDTSGDNRFRNPIPPTPWTEIFVADTLRDVCPQGEGGVLEFSHPGWDKFSEDCLHLNVYSPDVNNGPYPVMVWLYGGGYSSGANIQYPGHFLASHDVVVVTVNYRVNKFGFAFTGTPACPGNAGLWDQNMAIHFVIDNIANFGGDPSRITVFGESAGAASASMQMLSPMSKDLFHQAIMESGAETNPWAFALPETEPEKDIYEAAAGIGCNRTTDEEMMDCLRALSWEELYENTTGFGGGPVVDGPGGFMPMTPVELREQGDIMTGPIISGINHDDASLYVIGFAPETLFGCCNRTHFKRIIENRLVRVIGGSLGLDNVTQQNVVESLMYNYSPWPHIYDNWSNRDGLVKMTTDVMFGAAWNRQVSEHQKVGPTWAYIYNYRGRNSSSLIPEWMGVPHIAELPYVWGYTLLPLNPLIVEDSEIEFDLIHWTDEDVQHTVFLQTLWSNFAKTGNPTPTPVDNPLGGSTVWPRFDHEEMNVMVISNTSIEAEVGWRQEDYYFWSEYMAYLVGADPGMVFAPELAPSSHLETLRMLSDAEYIFEELEYFDDYE